MIPLRAQALLSLSFLFSIQSPATKTPSTTGIILYDTIVDASVTEEASRQGSKPLLMIYQICDPACSQTGEINVDRVISEIDRLSGGSPPEWGMLDFEDPFMAWLETGPDSEQYRTAARSMIRTMETVRQRFSKTKWTYYQIPYIRYWIGGTSWDKASDTVRRSTLERMGQLYGSIARACDWLSPSIYSFYDPENAVHSQQESVRQAGRVWRFTQTAFSKLMSPGRPVIPILSPLWQINGDAKVGHPVPESQFREDVLRPCIDAGADGFVVWTAYSYYITTAIDNRRSDQPAFDRSVVTSVLLGGTEPADWSDPEVKIKAKSAAARVVVRAIEIIRQELDRHSPPTTQSPKSSQLGGEAGADLKP
jgi:hypothetical protein